jgi:hypothetical protein
MKEQEIQQVKRIIRNIKRKYGFLSIDIESICWLAACKAYEKFEKINDKNISFGQFAYRYMRGSVLSELTVMPIVHMRSKRLAGKMCSIDQIKNNTVNSAFNKICIKSILDYLLTIGKRRIRNNYIDILCKLYGVDGKEYDPEELAAEYGLKPRSVQTLCAKTIRELGKIGRKLGLDNEFKECRY